MTFTEAWFGEPSCQAVQSFVSWTRPLTGRIVEVGCWEGRSTVAIARAAAPEYIHAVDTWKGSPGEISANLAASRNVFETFTDNIAELTEGNVYPFRMGWREYVLRERDPVKFLHIDAEHTYREVSDTIDAFLPFMVDGSIMCGDDNHHEPVMQAVWEHFPGAALTATEWWVKL